MNKLEKTYTTGAGVSYLMATTHRQAPTSTRQMNYVLMYKQNRYGGAIATLSGSYMLVIFPNGSHTKIGAFLI
jgi:hypothetical protein